MFLEPKDLNVDKAPRPNGMMMPFFQPCSGVVREEMTGMMHYFHEHIIFDKSFNASFIA